MSIANYSVKRPVMVTMILLIFVVFGIIAYFNLNLNLMPDVKIPYVNITTIYPGASSEEIETQVSKRIEDSVSQISGIKRIVSYSFNGASLVNIEFNLDKDGDIANQEVKDKVDNIINDLPPDIEKPIVEKLDIAAKPVCDVLLAGDLPLKELYELADKKLTDLFAQIPGVANVNLVGGGKREVHIELNPTTVFEERLSILQLMQIIKAQNIDLPSGHFFNGGQEISVKTKGRAEKISDLQKIEFQGLRGRRKLSEIAEIKDGVKEVRKRTKYFNKKLNQSVDKAVLMEIVKNPDGNVVKVVNSVKEKLGVINKTLPHGCTLKMVREQASFVRETFNDTMLNIILGIFITGFILFLFLHNVRGTFIVSVVIPYSIISTLMFLNILDYSLNVMTLMGFSISVGVLVSNAVVVLENIFKHKAGGASSAVAAAKGTDEVFVAVFASALTNIVVFLPIANMSSLSGAFFKEFAMTVTIATVFSLIASFTLTPLLSAKLIKDIKEPKLLGSFVDKTINKLSAFYSNILNNVMKSKLRSSFIILIAIVALVITLSFSKNVGMSFVPVMDEGDINVEIELPVTANIQKTAETVKIIEDKIKEYKYLKQIITLIGTISKSEEGVNMALLKLKMIPVSQREVKVEEIAHQLKDRLSNIIPGVRVRVRAVSQGAGGELSPLEFYIQGDDMKLLEKYSQEMLLSMKENKGLYNINSSLRPPKPEINFIPDRVKLAQANVSVYDIALSLRAVFEGIEISTIKEKGETYDIRLTLKDEEFDTPEKIAAMTIVSSGRTYRLEQLGKVEFIPSYNKIIHNKKYKAVKITATNRENFSLSEATKFVNNKFKKMSVKQGFNIEWEGNTKYMQETAADIKITFIIAVILTYMLIAGILESFIQPLIILATVPFAMIGVYAGLILTGIDMGLFSMLGIIMLIGIVVNNAILILDHANREIRSGLKVKEALIDAGKEKLRPIIMSTLAIIFGMLPMALGVGAAGREARQPIGVVSIGGLIISTLLTLIVIPAIFYMIYGKKED